MTLKRFSRILCVIMALLFCALACAATNDAKTAAETAAPSPVPTEEPTATPIEKVQVTPLPAQVTEEPTPLPTPEPTEISTEEPTPEPTPEPVTTRAPKEGDIATVNFPDYDTGADADYSYQSDELRIAIKVVVDAEAKQTVYVADIWMRSMDSFRTVFAKGGYNKGSEDGDALAKNENASLAVNGCYNQGLIVHQGTKFKNARAAKGWNSQAYCVIYKDGTMKTFLIKNEKFDMNRELKNGAWHAWQFGPILIRDYEPGPDYARYKLGYKARNILGYYEPGHYVLVTCDAYRDDAKGWTEQDMVQFMQSLGVKDAFNLDGGTSAVMVFMGEVINRPTPTGSGELGRELVDMLVFAEYDPDGNAPDLSTVQADKFKGRD